MSNQGQESHTVIVRADEEMRALASKALEIQDACNFTAVANHLAHTYRIVLARHKGDSELARKHPVVRAVLNKLNQLANLQQSQTMCFCHCQDLADGKDISVDLLDEEQYL